MSSPDVPAVNRTVQVGPAKFSNNAPIAIFAGPCQLESRAHGLEMAAALSEIAARLGIGFVFKASFDKANRTSLDGARGLGLEQSLPILSEIRDTYAIPVVTDVHEPGQCAGVAEVVDVI